MITINILLTEQQMVQSFLDEMARRRLPERFFYWFPPSLRAWLDLCSDGAYKNYRRSYNMIASHATDLARRIPAGTTEVVSLGAGQGDKDRLLLRALVAAGHDVTYKPVDASQGLLEMACASAVDENIATVGLKADLTDPDHLSFIVSPQKAGRTRVIMLVGNTLGAFDPANYVSTLHGLLAPGDYLLVDGEIYTAEETMAGYDNPLNRRFAFGPLTSIGMTEADGDLVFELEEDSTLPGLYRLTKHFRASHSLTISLAGRQISLHAGEKIAMNYSGKYSRERFDDLLHFQGRLKIEARYESPDFEFVMALLKRAN